MDRENEFLVKFRNMITNDYSIRSKPITSRIPQANSILELVHQTIGNILCTFKIHDMVLDEDNLWDGILPASTMFDLKANVHTTTQYMLAHLVFGHDSILYQHLNIDWEALKKRK